MLKELVKTLQKEIAELKSKPASSDAPATAVNSAGSKAPASPPRGSTDTEEQEEADFQGPSLEAARQRLRRMCIRNKQGNLKVPQAIHEKYVAGGEERDRLLKILVKTNFEKDPSLIVTHKHVYTWPTSQIPNMALL